MVCSHRLSTHSQHRNGHDVYRCAERGLCTETDVGIIINDGSPMAVCASCPQFSERPRAKFAYYVMAGRSGDELMANTLIRSARAVGVEEEFHVFSLHGVPDAIMHKPPPGPWRFMQKLEVLRELSDTVDADAYVLLDSDSYFVRKPDLDKLLRGNPLWVQMEGDLASPKFRFNEWWGAPTNPLIELYRQFGANKQPEAWNTNAGMFIVRRGSVEDIITRAEAIYDEVARRGWKNPATGEEIPLAILGQSLVDDPYLNTVPATCDQWATDWLGSGKPIPNGQPWTFTVWATGEEMTVHPAIVHAMRSKDALREAGRPENIDLGAGCVHRGSMLRTEHCQIGCPATRFNVPIFACDKHIECAPRRWQAGLNRMAECVSCGDRTNGNA